MLRIAILGVGWAGQHHVQAIRELGDKVTVDCLVDNDAAFLNEQARSLQVHKLYTDYRQALNDPQVDAVSICLPHDLHCAVAVEAAAAGKHILCEKPIAITVEQATQMIEAARRHGVKLYVAENAAYSAMADFLRQAVEQKQYIGNLTSVARFAGYRARPYAYPGRRAWLATKERAGGGTWMLHGIHTIAELRYILGEVEVVYVREHHAASFERTDVEGTMSGLLTLASGVAVFVVQTCETYLPDDVARYVIHGDEGTIRAWPDRCEVFSEESGSKDHPTVLNYPEQRLSSYAREIEAFADYVAGVRVGPTTAESERRSLAVIQAGYESARTGKPVNLKQRFGQI